MNISLRPAMATDAAPCGRIIYEAFKEVAERHGFTPDFPAPEAGTQLAGKFIAHPAVYGVVAEADGRIVGSNFMSEGDPVRGVGPITVAPAFQGRGIGRRLMQAVLDRGKNAASIRLLQDGFNTCSVSLYASLGFELKEPMLLMRGKPAGAPPSRFAVRPMTSQDLDACASLSTNVHGFDRRTEVRDALQAFTPFVVERDGRTTGYMTAPTFWIANHGIAETEEDMRALVEGAAMALQEPVAFLVPARRTSFFRWCLSEGMKVMKPMVLMALGEYRDPTGCYVPSVFY
jgi:GNAT superfamily N-acetyltransferase